jgi:hypothetical protein
MTKRLAAATLLLLVAGTAAPAAAQQPAQPRPVEEQNASETRERLRQILDQYPPSVRQVLRCDPSLLVKPDYMATYPTLAAYVGQHPEVAHNPAFFMSGVCGGGGGGYSDARSQAANAIENIFVGLEVMLGIMFGIGTLGWVIRSAIDYRRWQHAMRIQTDAHTKIVDRLATNEDLLTYVQSPAGQRFLNASGLAPAAMERVAMPMNAPVNRILWSVQAGIVLAVAGAGLWIAKNGIIDEVAQAMQVLAVLVMALGIGFVLSAVAAYLLSKQLGLVSTQSDHA